MKNYLLVVFFTLTVINGSHQSDCTCVTNNTVGCDSTTGNCVCKTGWTGRNCSQDIDECSKQPCLSNATCKNLPGSYQCLCRDGSVQNATRNCIDLPLIKCEVSSADIIFVLDSSGSIGFINFQLQLNFTARIVSSLHMISNDIRFGLLEFSDTAIKIFDLKQYNTTEELEKIIMAVPFIGSGTATDMALEFIRTNQMFSQAAGGRPDAPDIIITMTDGSSNDPVKTASAASALKATGVTMLTIGITSGVNLMELQVLSTKPEYVILADTFTTLDTKLAPLLNTTCTAIAIKENKTVIPDVCENGQFINGVTQVSYPKDCTKVIQCYTNPTTKKTLAVIRRCPLGEFWDQTNLTCAPSWTVQCPFDKCKRQCSLDIQQNKTVADNDLFITYAMTGSRRGYYACKNGKSYPNCCPRHNEYVTGKGCDVSPGCTERCGKEKKCSNGVKWCQKVPVWEDQKKYKQMPENLDKISCGSDFNILDCKCDVMAVGNLFNPTLNCAEYFQTKSTKTCIHEIYDVPIRRQDYNTPNNITFILTEPLGRFKIKTKPETRCKDSFSLEVWGDENTINVAVRQNYDRVLSPATVLWKSSTGSMEVTVMFHKGLMTLALTKGSYTIVNTVEATLDLDSMECSHYVKVESDDSTTCLLSNLVISDCNHPSNYIYTING